MEPSIAKIFMDATHTSCKFKNSFRILKNIINLFLSYRGERKLS